jgi:large-conductance mechanosensitive channel
MVKLIPDDFKTYLVDNNVLQVASAMTFGVATVAFVKAFVADFMLPLIYMVITRMFRLRSSNVLDALLRNKEMQFSNFAAELVTYVMILISCFLLIQYVFRRYLGVVASKQATGKQATGNMPHIAQTTVNYKTPSTHNIDDGDHNRVVFFDVADA